MASQICRAVIRKSGLNQVVEPGLCQSQKKLWWRLVAIREQLYQVTRMQRNRERVVLDLFSNLQWLRLFPFFGEPLGHVRILRGQILVSRTGDDLPPLRVSVQKRPGVSVQNVPVKTDITRTCFSTSWTLLQACALRNSSLRKLPEQAPLSQWRLVCAVITRRWLDNKFHSLRKALELYSVVVEKCLGKHATSYVIVPLSDHPLMLALRSWRLALFYGPGTCDGWNNDV